MWSHCVIAQAVKHGSLDHCSVERFCSHSPTSRAAAPATCKCMHRPQPPATRESMCRHGDFAAQQQIASKLHKLVGAGDDYYIWWTIAAITLQAKAALKGAASALPADKLFQLAEVMTAKQAQKGSLQTYEQLSLYLDILQVPHTASCGCLLSTTHTCFGHPSPCCHILYLRPVAQSNKLLFELRTARLYNLQSCTHAQWNHQTRVTRQE